ncbi:MAG: PASTA domain-containing protein [Deltaproteobacteria bacterium]|nr:PASTA domain-containing protein [Deltaproteobacteria bacterium]
MTEPIMSLGPAARAPSRATPSRPTTPGIPRNARVRAYVVGSVVVLGLCGVAHKAYTLQVEEGEKYREQAERQHLAIVNMPAPRGDIYDVHGRPLAVSADAESIWANPREIRDVTATAEKLAALLDNSSEAALEARLGGDRRFVWVERHVRPEVAAAVRKAKLAGIEVVHEPRRWYPGRAIGGPVIGRADVDGNGVEGLELAMNAALTGTRGNGVAVRDARGRRMFADGLEQPSPGNDVTLTIDRSIQAIADAALAESVVKNQAKSGVAVVLDVATGRALALSSYPTFDPNAGGHAARNRAVTDTFEAGSIIKMFVIASALDAGIVAPDSEFDVSPGWMMVGTKRIPDVHATDKILTVSQIIKRSSNVGTVKIAQRFGRERLYAALKRFGFGAKSGIELPGEQAGTLRAGSTWRDIELATISYGYGLTVTPLQVAAALAAIGNGGTYHPPRIIDRVVDGDGRHVGRVETPGQQVIAPAVAGQVRKMLATVFEGGPQNGTAHAIVVPGYRTGGKTGTAHKWDAEAKQYSLTRYLSSFAGLAPIDDPRLAIVVLVDEPSGGDYYGGKVAGPVFATIASETLRYLGVPGLPLVCAPDAPKPAPLAITPAKTCLPPPADAAQAARQIADTAPAAGDAATEEVVAGGVPDFTGMGVGRALDVARAAKLAIAARGTGRVIAQLPLPGTPLGELAPGARIDLTFSDGVLTETPRRTETP